MTRSLDLRTSNSNGAHAQSQKRDFTRGLEPKSVKGCTKSDLAIHATLGFHSFRLGLGLDSRGKGLI